MPSQDVAELAVPSQQTYTALRQLRVGDDATGAVRIVDIGEPVPEAAAWPLSVRTAYLRTNRLAAGPVTCGHFDLSERLAELEARLTAIEAQRDQAQVALNDLRDDLRAAQQTPKHGKE